MSSIESSGLPSSTGATQTMQMLNHALLIKLDRNNYVLWRTQMENVIFANGFEDHIEGLKICPPQKTSSRETNPDFILWRRFDRMILSWIYSSLTPEIMGQIFQTTRKGSLTMMEYILKLNSLADNLAAIGEPVTDRDQIIQLLGGLGADYNSIVASLTAREDEMSLHSVHNILLTHEQRLSFQNLVAEDNIISANLATPQYQHFNNKRSSNTNPYGQNRQFDINFQGNNPNMDTSQTNKPNAKNQVQAMIASPSTISDEAWLSIINLPFKFLLANHQIITSLKFSVAYATLIFDHTTKINSLIAPINMSSSTTLPDLIQVPFADISTSEPHFINQHPMVTRAKNGISKKNAYLSSHTSEPTTFTQAVKDPNWVLAMKKEFSALQRNNTWHLVPLPSNSNIIGCKWVYKLKYKPDGTVDRYKARLVAQGFTQTLGLDYFETFSPVVKASTIRIILAVALSFNWSVHQLDVQNAFLHGDLEEHVFMHQPPGFINSQFPSHVCKPPRAWYTKLSTSLLGWGFQASRADSSMFIHHSTQDVLILLIYVDDILVTDSNSAQVSSFITRLNSSFALHDLGYVNYFLGIEVVHYGTMFHLSQHKYTQDLLTRTAMLDSKPATTPGLLGQMLSHLDGEPLSDATLYGSTVGALQYLTLTRLDISFAVNKACQFMAAPTTTHWLAVKRILRYLKGTLSYDIQMQQSTLLDIHGYTDANWASFPDDRRSTESEYRALASTTSEIIWIQSVLQELCLSSSSPPLLWCDNKSAAHLAANLVFHARTKHIEMDLHFIRDHVLRKQLIIQYLSSSEQVADIFTKHISSSQFLSFRMKLSVIPSPVSLRGDDRQYLADQQERNKLESAATNQDQPQQTGISCNKLKSVKNVLK
ncbi:hypothetical protein PVL29_020488 [Vitis rotundifolia]|uniref:Reverse transcriptase Ty1/copia-type domain-containing protein n=1 Tax=Vitis rotundifolia TaxID=103349 RepID=A0AA38YXA1_VITRO|nr:hypothetical protein PVL29_020488 [Vitis rotundifolia]